MGLLNIAEFTINCCATAYMFKKGEIHEKSDEIKQLESQKIALKQVSKTIVSTGVERPDKKKHHKRRQKRGNFYFIRRLFLKRRHHHKWILGS